MAAATLTTDFVIAAPVERVWGVLRNPQSMRYWQGVTDVRPTPTGAEVVGEIKLPVGKPVRLTSKLVIKDDSLVGDTATTTLVIENPRTTLRWTLHAQGDNETFCGLVVEYLTPSGMLGMVLNGSILKKVIVDNIRQYVKSVREELNPPNTMTARPFPA